MLDKLSYRAELAGRRAAAIARILRENVFAHARARVVLRNSNSVGRNARCFGRVHIENRGRMRMGDDFALGGALAAVQIATAPGGILGIGDEVTIEYGTSISVRSGLSIGSRVRFGPYCVISDSELPLPLDLPSDWSAREIMIGDDVWIGARVTVMPGVRIGDRAVVAAGSVVTADIDDDALAAGSPATTVRVAVKRPRIVRARAISADTRSMVD